MTTAATDGRRYQGGENITIQKAAKKGGARGYIKFFSLAIESRTVAILDQCCNSSTS